MDRGGNQKNASGDDPRYPEFDVGDTFDIGDEPISAAAGVVRYQGSRLPKPTKCNLNTLPLSHVPAVLGIAKLGVLVNSLKNRAEGS
jgi:hypothetical protein